MRTFTPHRREVQRLFASVANSYKPGLKFPIICRVKFNIAANSALEMNFRRDQPDVLPEIKRAAARVKASPKAR